MSLARLPSSRSRVSTASPRRSKPVSRSTSFGDEFIAAFAGFGLPRFTLFHHLFLSGQHGGLSHRFRFALAFANQATALIVSGDARDLLPGNFSAGALVPAQEERQTGRDKGDKAQCGRENGLRHDLYLQRGRAAVFGSPGDAAQQDCPRWDSGVMPQASWRTVNTANPSEDTHLRAHRPTLGRYRAGPREATDARAVR